MKRTPAPIPNGGKVHPMVYLQRIMLEAYALKFFINSYNQCRYNKNGVRVGKLAMNINNN